MTYPRRMITKTAFTPTGPSTYGSAPGIWRMDEVAYWQKQGLWPNPSVVPDTYFPYVSLLLSSTSLSNANNNLFVDSSGAFNPVSRNGNTAQGSFTPYGSNWSNYFDGSGDYLTLSGGVTNNGTGDLCLEFWSYYTGTYAGEAVAFDSRTSPFTNGFAVTISNSNGYWTMNFTVQDILTSTPAAKNQWQHVAVTRSGNTFRLFVDGVLAGTLTSSNNLTSTTNVIGSSYSAGSNWPGYISNLRAIKGSIPTAYQTSSTTVGTSVFTPPAAPLTAISGTSLLTCQSNRFIDNSSNAFAITVNGDTKVQKFSPFSSSTYTGISYNQSDITNWSGWFNGGTDRLQVPVTSNMYLGTTYTIEAWVYYNSTSIGARPIFSEMEPFQGGFAGLTVLMNSSGQFAAEYRPATSGTVTAITGPAVVPYTWYHVALSVSSSSAKFFINGTQVGSTTTFGDYPSAKTNTVAVGGWGSGWVDGGIPAGGWIGYISNMRVVKGTAVYTSNFTPSTTNLTAISGTVLLTCQNAAFTDNSSVNNILTPVTNATVTGNSPFNTTGYWSNYFDGSTGYLSVNAQTALSYGTGDFTMEAWVYPTSINSGFAPVIEARASASATTYAFGLRVSAGVYKTELYTGTQYTGSTTVSLNTWTHIAVSRSSGTLRLFVNGVLDTSWSSITTSIDANAASQLIGVLRDGAGYYFPGYISNFRAVKGTAVYTSNFTVPTTPLSAITNTSLLTCQNGSFKDNSSNAFTLVPAGNVATQSFDPFYTATIASNGGSMYFDGSGDYLALQSSPNYALGSGDFTLDMWVYPVTQGGHGSGNNDCLMDFRPGSNGAYGTLYIYNSGASVNWYANTAVQITGGAIKNGAWSHLCVSRVSGSTRLFINGVQSGSTYADSTNYLQTNPWIGQFNDGPGSGYFNGYMMAPRIVKGSGVSANFTPPTAPVTPTAATTLLLNGMNAGIYDATTINDMETVGNAQVSTVQSKFGGSSVYFDGTGDWLTMPVSPNTDLGSGDFTVEFWAYPTTKTNVVDAAFGYGSFTFMCYHNNTNWTVEASNNGSSNQVVISTPVTLNTWQLITITRSGTTVRLFKDGVVAATGTLTGAINTAGKTLRVGDNGNSQSFTGYIDDLRITKGVARYTANFTPPTQAFPVY